MVWEMVQIVIKWVKIGFKGNVMYVKFLFSSVEAYGESTVHDMPTFKIEFAANPNSSIIKINK